jgi:hypothetical protein
MKRCKKNGNGNAFLNFASLLFVCSVLPLMAGSVPHNPGSGGTFVPTPASGERGTAVTNLTTMVSYGDLQTAIDDASAGNTLQVNSAASPLSTGLVLLDKSLTIQGENSSVVVLANTSSMGPATGDGRAWFLVTGGVTVTIQDLIFDGNNTGGVRIVDGFRLNPGNSGTFNRCVFRDIEYLSDGADELHGFGITAGGVTDVNDCTFMDIGIVGLFYFGSGVNGSVADGNTFRGQGAGPVIDYGVELGGGAAATVMNSDFADNLGTYDILPGGSTSAGILVTTFFGGGTSLTAISNAFANNTVGILVGNTSGGGDSSTVDASFNTFVGNTNGGIDSDSSSTADAENNWWGCSTGPGSLGCDTAIDNVDANPWLVLDCTLDPNPVEVGTTGTVTGSLNSNSDGQNTSGLGFVIDGTIISFDALGGGGITPASGGTVNGVFSATYSAFGGPNVTIVCSVNGQPDGEGFQVTITVPTLGEIGMIAFVLLLATAAVVMMHKHRRMA